MSDIGDDLSALSLAKQERGFDGTLQPGVRPALLVIDFVRAYLARESPLYAGVEDARVACVKLLSSARYARIPVLHTTVVYQRGGRNGGLFFKKVPALACFEQDQHPIWAAFAEGLEPEAGETLITKQYASAFFGTSLASTLTSLRVDTLLIAGVSTSGCVRATTVDACQHGFVPMVVRDAVGDRTAGRHESSLFDLQAKYAEVISLQEASGYLFAHAATNSQSTGVDQQRPVVMPTTVP